MENIEELQYTGGVAPIRKLEISKLKSNPIKNSILLHPSFSLVIEELCNAKLSLPSITSNIGFNPNDGDGQNSDMKLSMLEPYKQVTLDSSRGQDICAKNNIVAYDESIDKFMALEGTAYLTSHSLIMMAEEEYIPLSYITMYFYTKSKSFSIDSNFIKLSQNPQVDFTRDYIIDKLEFILSYCPNNSLLLIDGTLIGGDLYTILIDSINHFIDKNIIPVFIVKNSSSSIISENIEELRGRYNSDLHWSYHYLQRNERSPLFKYTDQVNAKNSKIFSYLKIFDKSPIRVEFHEDTYERFKGEINGILDLICYLVNVQGNAKNPQVRPIFVAEMFARETKKLVNFEGELKKSGIMPTMNQDRFAW